MQFIILFTLIFIWIKTVANYDIKDGDCVSSKDECNSCPFPCDKRKK